MLHKTKHFWYQYQKAKNKLRLATGAFRAMGKILSLLSKKPESAVNEFDRFIAFLSTPLKRLGVFGWKGTGKVAKAAGTLIRKPVRSSDGFWTLDIRLSSLSIRGLRQKFGNRKDRRYIRIEVEPGTRAHKVCEETPPKKGHHVETLAPIVIDYDGPFLELHPTHHLKVKKPK